MADNILKRIIQLILDKDAARRVNDENKSLADSVENSWKKAAERIAEFLGIAFLTEKLIEFGKSAVEHASEAQLAWSQLEGTIDATGGSFVDLEAHLRSASKAFQDATTHEDEEYVKSLTRMIALTGDVSASTNNMGLVANVAARFYKGELEPAVNLVAKAMNGKITALQRLGIVAKDAQDALEILARRSMGAATREAESFTGQLKQMHNSWNDLLESFGDAIIKSGGATNAITVLRGAITTLIGWIDQNKEAIAAWVTNGVAFAIDSLDVLIRAVQLVANTVIGIFQTSLGVGAGALAELSLGFILAREAGLGFLHMLGIHTEKSTETTRKWREEAEALKEWAKRARDAGDASAEAAKKNLFQPLFSSSQFKGVPKVGPLEVNAPEVGKNVSTDATKEVQKAIEEFNKATLAAENMKKILGEQFDSVGADIDRTTKLLNVLAGNGIQPATVGFAGLAEHLHTLTTVTKPLTDAQKELAKALQSDLATGLVTAGTGMENATTKLDSLKARQADVMAEIKKMSGTVLENSAAYKDLVEQYDAYAVAIDDQSKVQALTDANKELAKSLTIDLTLGAIGGASAIEQLKSQQSNLAQEMRKLLTEGVDPLSEGFQDLVDRYNSVTDAMKQAESIQRTAVILHDLGETIRQDLFIATLNGATALDKLKIKQQDLAAAIRSIGIPTTKAQEQELERLAARYREVTLAIQQQTVAMQFQATIADLLADILGTAMQGGLAHAAAQKAKQNAIEAAEMVVRAGVFALFGNFPAASAALVAAAQFGVLAAAWGALSLGSSGGGGSTSAPSVSVPLSSNSSGGQDLSSSRGASSQAASRSETPSAEVSIYLVGPGFNALNPEVQKVVRGAAQEAAERYGTNSRIRIRTSDGV